MTATDETDDTDDLEPDRWDRTARWIARHGALPCVGLLTIAAAIVYAGVFRGEPIGDDLTFHMAESARLADCLRVGDWDCWNPSANAGFASAYYYQVVPQLASAIPAALFGGHLFWFQLSVFLPLVLTPLAAYRGVRILGAVPWQAALAAFALAVTIGASRWGFGADGTFTVGLYTQTWALAVFPLALGHAVRWATHGRGLTSAVAWSALVGLCHPFAVIALGIALLFGFLLGQLAMHGVDHALAVLGSRLVRDPDPSPSARALAARWRRPAPVRFARMFLRLALFAVLLAITQLPTLVPLVVDYAGFGGFPHRVSDEVGPGFGELAAWFVDGKILDHRRPLVLTALLPVVLVMTRVPFSRWLWAPALAFALLLGLGPHLGKTGDDLLPAVRFLGAMQIVLALAIGAGAYDLGKMLWNARDGQTRLRLRTGLAAVAAALVTAAAVPGAGVQVQRIRVLGDHTKSHRDEMMAIIGALSAEPAGRKQVGPGCENHWWNQLSYVYARIPSLLQMGGGGLQASPSYDFLFSVRDFARNAWIYDAPYLVFDKAKGDRMPAGELVYETDHYVVRRLPSPGLVSPIQITGVLPPGSTRAKSAARTAAIAWVKSGDPRANRHLAYRGHGEPGAPPQGKVLRASRQDSPGDAADLVAEVEVTALTTFVFRESWHPRWRAYLDGREVPVLRVTPDFPAVEVPPGHHLLELRFARPWWVHAAWLAWPGAIVLAWLSPRARRRRR